MKNTIGSTPYLIIGSGRLGRHLQHYFTLLHIPFNTWNRLQPKSDLAQALSLKPTVLLAISDQSLTEFYQNHLDQKNLKVVHFSGAFHDSRMISCHPLMTFSDRLFSLDDYKKIHWAITGALSLKDIFPELPNFSFQLQQQHKALYHALCVLSAAGTQTLWNSALSQMKSLGVSQEAFSVYIEKITENFIHSPESSLTGPWVRKDQTTIDKNIQALPAASAEAYKLLMKGLL